MALFGNRVFSDVIELKRSYWIRIGSSTITDVLLRRQNLGTDTCDDRARDWSEASTSQGIPSFDGNHQKLIRSRKRFFLRTFRGSVVPLTL